MGKQRTGRAVHGILLLDKPAGISSNRALQFTKRLFQASKAGHTGSLDPFATGLLPICFGEATKISGYLLNSDKRYVALARLGEQTTTGDLDGDLAASAQVPGIGQEDIQAAMHTMCGESEQIPPMFSAIKQDGTRLYEFARAGVEVERQPRSITIHEFKCLDWNPPDLRFVVHCSKGTYVRTLAEDLASRLGSLAHLRELRRTQAGVFQGEDMVSVDELSALEGDEAALDGQLLPLDAALPHLDSVSLDDSQVRAICQGQKIQTTPATAAGIVRIYTCNGEILGLGELREDGSLAPKRLFSGLVPENQAG